jgi:integrase
MSRKFYLQKRRGDQWVITIRVDGKTVAACPRELYRHLDGQPEHNVRYWIDQNLVHPVGHPLSDDALTRLVDDFCAHLRDSENKRDGTIAEHRRNLFQRIIPFFLGLEHPLADPNDWPLASPQMLKSFRKNKVSDSLTNKCNVALRKFWKYLVEENHVRGDKDLVTRNPSLWNYSAISPLKLVMTPEEILGLVGRLADRDYAIFVLLGYFCSLRPQEIFGLRLDRIKAGQEVTFLEAAARFRRLGLYDRLVVDVINQKTKKLKIEDPKKGSKGIVACFNRDAAVALAKLTADMEDGTQFLLRRSPNEFYKEWPFRKGGTMPDGYPCPIFAPKDLRRASLYWLGHNTDISEINLKKHARQKSSKSLELYLRTPEQDVKNINRLLKVDDL